MVRGRKSILRLIATDLDGTLLRSDGSVSERSRRALAAVQKLGIRVVLVSARAPRSVSRIAAEVGVDGLAICANGASVYDLGERRIVRHRPLPSETALRIVAELRRRAPGVVFGWEIEERFGSEPGFEALRDAAWPRPEDADEPVDAASLDTALTKIFAKHPSLEQADLHALAVAAAGDEAAVWISGRWLVEISAAGVNKGAALEELCVGLSIAAEDVLAFGDYPNDLPLLRWAGRAIAPANAHPDVLASVDEVTAPNDEDGVAIALERLVLRR